MTTKPTGDIAAQRLSSTQLSCEFADIAPLLDPTAAAAAASRCHYCYDAPCVQACPTQIDIPSFIRKIGNGNLKGAATDILSANPLGGMCARVCPTEILCEGACVRNHQDAQPVAIGALQRHATDWAMETGAVRFTRAPDTGRHVAVVGAGPAGLACSTVLAQRGHRVDLFDGAAEIGGQFNMAKRIPGKEEFHEALSYFGRQVELTGVNLHLNRRVDASDLIAGGYDEIVLATGVAPRDPKIPGQDGPNVLSYIDVLAGKQPVGRRVAVVGAGGIGFDVAEYLVQEGESPALDLEEWKAEWGVTDPATTRGGVTRAQVTAPAREVTLLQRKAAPLGKGLGKTTGWIHRATLKMKQVKMIGGVNYERIDARGLHVSYGEQRTDHELIEADTIVLCTGQEPQRALLAPLQAAGRSVHLIGGAELAAELDAKRAIDQGSRLAARL